VPTVLKITEMSRSAAVRTLKLEGKVLGPWLDELRRICNETTMPHVRLDLAAVTFVDAAAAKLLTELIGQGVAIIRCSSYVAELLHLDLPS
jgi:anti-anti-sigma regulatory factor